MAVLLLAVLSVPVASRFTLWIVTVVLLVAWAIGFVARAGSGARWYRW